MTTRMDLRWLNLGSLRHPQRSQAVICTRPPPYSGYSLLSSSSTHSTEGIYLRTRSDSKLFNLTRLKAIFTTSLTKRVWKNGKLTENTKIQVYRAFVLSTLLYGSESWVLHARNEHKLNTSHLRNLSRILNIAW